MNLNQIKARLEDIEKNKDDYESAHAEEDNLYADFVRHVRDCGPDDLKEMAEEVLKSIDIEFPRHRA